MTDNGYTMHLMCSPADDTEKFAHQQGIQYFPVILNRQLTPMQDLKSLIMICRYIRKNHIDTVIGHQVKGRLLATVASLLTRVPNVIIFAHGAIFETASGLKRKLLILESKLESVLSDKVVCVSKYIKDLRIEYRIDRPEKQIILGAGTCGGIDTNNRFNRELINPDDIAELKKKYAICQCDFVIGFVGRLVKDKGIVELIDAFNIMKRRNPNQSLKLMIVGPQEKRDGLPDSVLHVLQDSPDIIYTGHILLDDMPKQYCCMDCLVLPSHREGFGFCNLEAQAMGIPVLTSHITGCRDSIINGLTGLYIELNSGDIADKIEIMLDVTKRQKMGEEGSKWVKENFDHTKIWPHVKKLLEEMNDGKE